MDSQLHCLHCYGHASARLHPADAYPGQSIVKTVQRRVISYLVKPGRRNSSRAGAVVKKLMAMEK